MRKEPFDRICLRNTGRSACAQAMKQGFTWDTQIHDDAFGPVQVKGLLVPSLDKANKPVTVSVDRQTVGYVMMDFAVAARWAGIESMNNQHRLDELREILYAATGAINSKRWQLPPADNQRWLDKIRTFGGSFAVILPPDWEGYWGLAPQ
jgi:hypothetical protein